MVDGTKISLNSGSELKLAEGFSSENRIVSLTGEGYFEVTSDPSNPFIVKTKDFNVRVTGTAFNVCVYPNDQFSSTTLLEGKVELTTKNKEKFRLSPGKKLLTSQETGKSHLANVDADSEIAWKDGAFVFKEITFAELIRRLERWYDVKINYSSPEFNSMLYSGRFKNQETIWQVLDALKLTTPIDYEKSNFREFNLIYKPM